jgi:hypothetical protein
MKRSILGAVVLGALVLVATAGAAPPIVAEPFFIQSGTPPVLDGPTDAFFSTVP